jgi:hypothetical protein
MIDICANIGDNTGKGTCPVRMKYPKYALPGGATFTDAQLATPAAFKVALRAAMLLPNGTAGKVVVFPKANQQTDNTGAASPATLADGYSEVLVEKLPSYTLDAVTDYCTTVAMHAYNGYLGGVFIVDGDNVLWYVKATTNRGFTIGNLHTPVPRFGTISAIQTVQTQLTFGSVDEFLSAGALKLDFDVATLVNQVTVLVVEKAAQAANVFTLGIQAKCAGTDLTPAYVAALTNVARWVVTINGTVITITSVTASGNSLVITSDSTAYGAAASGAIIAINLASPVVLAAAGVTGIEGVAISYIKP